MKRILLLGLALILSLSLLTACGGEKDAKDPAEKEVVKIIVGASPTPHAEILEEAKPLLLEKGVDLEIKEFTEYIQPNLALDAKDIDANYFQHKPYLDDFNKEKNLDLVSAVAVHYEPFGIYPGKTKKLEDLKEGAKIAVPNDTTNEARALLLLEANGLIKIKPDSGLTATKLDIIENPNNYEIVELEAAQLGRTLPDVDVAVINGNFAIAAGLSVKKDALATEDAASEAAKTYANVLAVRAGDENRPEIQTLVEVLTSDEIKKFIDEKYDGAVVAIF